MEYGEVLLPPDAYDHAPVDIPMSVPRYVDVGRVQCSEGWRDGDWTLDYRAYRNVTCSDSSIYLYLVIYFTCVVDIPLLLLLLLLHTLSCQVVI